MIDEDFTVYLIESNTNPCLETNSAILSRIIPVMLDASFRLAVDPVLPPPELNFKRAHEALHENKYVQVFDESLEGETLKNLYQAGSQEIFSGDLSDIIGQQTSNIGKQKVKKGYNFAGYKSPALSKKSQQDFMDGGSVRSNIYSSLNGSQKTINSNRSHGP